LPLGSILKEIR